MYTFKITLILGFGGKAGLGDLSVPLTSGVDSGVLALCGGDNKMLCDDAFVPLKVLPLDESPDAVFLMIWGWEVTTLLTTWFEDDTVMLWVWTVCGWTGWIFVEDVW